MMSDTQAPPDLEPSDADLDQLIPPRLPRWSRIVMSIVVLGLTGTAGYLWSNGYIAPVVRCCGAGPTAGFISNGRVVAHSGQRSDAVTLSVAVENAGDQPVLLRRATVELPGATVLGVGIDPRHDQYPIQRVEPLPIRLTDRWISLVVTFVPTDCAAPVVDVGRGSVQLTLDVDNGPLPSITRTLSYAMPSVVEVLGAGAGPDPSGLGPIAAACALVTGS